MKAVLVIDMPKNCSECKLMYLQGIGEAICNPVDWEERPSWCPLKSMPKEMPMPKRKHEFGDVNYAYSMGIARGWNKFRKKILGESDESNISA